jgi:hypothetical protein
VEAAIAVQMMLSSKGESARQYLEPQIREITLELLNIIRETENDDLTSVMQKIVCTYTEQLVPVAVDICQHLVGTFAQVHSTHSFTPCMYPWLCNLLSVFRIRRICIFLGLLDPIRSRNLFVRIWILPSTSKNK